jgi:hypothetical protein
MRSILAAATFACVTMVSATVLVLSASPSAAPGLPASAALIKLSDPGTWAELDFDKLKGRPSRLAWADDDRTIYLQTVEGSTAATLKARHYLIKQSGAPSPIEAQPAWAQAYWKWKSAKTSFGDPLLAIDLITKRELVDNPSDRSTAYLNSEKIAPATLSSKGEGSRHTRSQLVLKGQVIGEFVDEQVYPGYTFSWSPETLRLIAFRAQTGRLTIMNVEGLTQPAGDDKDVWLPAWSESGDEIAYLDRLGRKKYALRVISAL